MTADEQRALTRGVAAGALVGLAAGLMIALFVLLR
jgi:hypothetical protein